MLVQDGAILCVIEMQDVDAGVGVGGSAGSLGLGATESVGIEPIPSTEVLYLPY